MEPRPIELDVIDLLLKLENEKSKQFITLFNQKDAPVVVRPPREDRMQVDEGATHVPKEYLDLSLTKRVSIKTQEDFEKEYSASVAYSAKLAVIVREKLGSNAKMLSLKT